MQKGTLGAKTFKFTPPLNANVCLVLKLGVPVFTGDSWKSYTELC